MKTTKKSFRKTKITCLVAALTFVGYQVTSAQTATEGSWASNSITQLLQSIDKHLIGLAQYINEAVGASVQTSKNLMYQPTAGIQQTMGSNLSQTITNPAIAESTTDNTQDSLKRTFTTTNPATILEKYSRFIPLVASDVQVNAGNFDFNSLLGTTNLNNSTLDNQAQNYVKFATGSADPFQTLSSSELKLTNPNVPQYLAELGIYGARQSIGLSNFYHLYAERQPVSNLGRLAQVTVNDKNNISFSQGAKIEDNASPLQVEKFAAERRADNPQWYAAMEKASPETVQRETLYVLAGIQKELYQLHMDNERQLATTSAMETQTNEATARPGLSRLQSAIIQGATARSQEEALDQSGNNTNQNSGNQ